MNVARITVITSASDEWCEHCGCYQGHHLCLSMSPSPASTASIFGILICEECYRVTVTEGCVGMMVERAEEMVKDAITSASRAGKTSHTLFGVHFPEDRSQIFIRKPESRGEYCNVIIPLSEFAVRQNQQVNLPDLRITARTRESYLVSEVVSQSILKGDKEYLSDRAQGRHAPFLFTLLNSLDRSSRHSSVCGGYVKHYSSLRQPTLPALSAPAVASRATSYVQTYVPKPKTIKDRI